MLRITDIQDNQVNWSTVPGCQIDEIEFSKYELHQNDILIARTGGTIGKTFLVEDLPIKAVFASYLIRVVPSPLLSARFLKLFLESPFYWDQIRANSAGTGQPNVNGVALSNLKLTLPPIEEQHRIVAKVDQLMSLCDKLEARQQKKRESRARLNSAALERLLAARAPGEFEQGWRCICDNFDLLYDTPENVSALRQAILQLAVMGKLVAQNANDELASILIGKIKAEKERLIKEKKINRSKPLPIKSEEIPYMAPNGWEWIRLQELGEFCGGATPSTNKSEYWGGGVPWVSPKDMKEKRIRTSELTISQKALDETRLRMIPKGSILIVGRSGILKRLLPVAVNDIECTVNQDLKVLIPFLPAISEYLQLMLKGHEQFILKNLVKGGMTVQSLKYTEFEQQPFPLPPIGEQRRIVAKVNQLMSLCDSLEASLARSQADGEMLMEAVVSIISGADCKSK
jgi:type I restriction enzyme S subunit